MDEFTKEVITGTCIAVCMVGVWLVERQQLKQKQKADELTKAHRRMILKRQTEKQHARGI